MSTNKTQNYNLHSWVPQDEFHLSEINENFTALDAALHQEVGVLDALLQAETAARTQQMAGKADAAALGQKVGLVSGSYVGNNGSQRIELGVKPKAVLVMAYIGYSTSVNYYGLGMEGYSFGGAITVDATGFTVATTGTGKNIFNIIENGVSYCYIAFY